MLKGKIVSGLGWSFVQELSQRVLQLGIGVLLARLLGPDEFGLVAMLTIFISVSQSIVECGFGSALIQKKTVSREDENSVFYCNIVIGLVLSAVLSLAAPLIASFYRQPTLVGVTRLWSLVLLINGFAVVQSALLSRRLDFKCQAIVSVTTSLASGLVGLGLALSGFGVWSLVWQQIANSAVRAAMLWFLAGWRPRWIFSWASVTEMFGFGSGMLASSLVDTLFENLYSMVIGRLYSPTTLGHYNRGSTLQETASKVLSAIANRVTFPVFSRLRDDPLRFRNGIGRAVATLSFAQFPLMLGLAVTAHPLILLLLGDKWEPCAAYLEILCLAGLFYPLHVLNLNVLMAIGRSDLFFRLILARRMLVVGCIIATLPWGVMGMVWGQLVISFISLYVNGYYSKRFVGYSVNQQLRDSASYMGAAIAMAAVVHSVRLNKDCSVALLLAVKVVTGIAVYLGLCWIFKMSAILELAAIIRPKLARVAS